MITETIHFENCRVDIYDNDKYLETVFDDGTKVPAAANYDKESLDLAAELGYIGDDPSWQMSRDHEVLHTRLMTAMGWPWSPVLWGVAHNVKFPLGTTKREESLVLEVQKLINKAVKEANRMEFKRESKGIVILCKACGSANLEYTDNDARLSMPPQREVKCADCDEIQYVPFI